MLRTSENTCTCRSSAAPHATKTCRMRALCTEGLAHRDQTKGLAVLVALSAGWPCTQLLAGLFWILPTAPSSSQPARGHPRSSPAPVTSCVQMYCQLLAEPTQGISCKLPPSRSSLPYGFRAGQCCKSCGTDAAVSVWHPLISSNSSVFQFVPGTAPVIPAALEQQPSAVATSHFSAQDLLASSVLDHILTVAI